MTYRSDLLAAIHEAAEDLHGAGVMTKHTLRRLDAMCLAPIPSPLRDGPGSS